MSEAADKFYAHLDACKQCEEHPFELCPVGQELIKATAKELGLVAPPEVQAFWEKHGWEWNPRAATFIAPRGDWRMNVNDAVEQYHRYSVRDMQACRSCPDFSRSFIHVHDGCYPQHGLKSAEECPWRKK